MHAAVHGALRTSDAREAFRLYRQVITLYERHELPFENTQEVIGAWATSAAADALEVPPGHAQRGELLVLAVELLRYEGHFALPEVDWGATRSVAGWWELRDKLSAEKQILERFEETLGLLVNVLVHVLEPLLDGCPSLLREEVAAGDIAVETELIYAHDNVPRAVEFCTNLGLSENLQEAGLFPRLRDRLTRNLVAASGGNPAAPETFIRALKLPLQSDEKDPQELVGMYLGGTPLLGLFRQDVTYAIPHTARFEHHHIVAGSGHGKTQTLQYLIANDLVPVALGEQSVIVLDSQGDLIRNIASHKVFAPGQPLHDRVVIIDPTDVEYPVSLNLFDVGVERLQGYDLLERERLTNSILELYDFVLGSLLSAEMTQKQNVIFRYVMRLMLHIPDATIHTLRELMEPKAEVTFAPYFAKLDGSARHFFKTEFTSREFEQTKKQVLRRLWGILENRTFERMFSHPKSKLDLFAEMNAGKVILINTAKDLLKEQGSQIFGRFFIALIAQAAQERATLPEKKRLPTFVYIDEAADYFDRNIGLILAQARKYKVGMVLAHQYLGQLDPKLQEAFGANTSIKFAGGVSAKDARTLAPMLYTTPDLIERQPKGSFAAHIRGVSKRAVPLSFPFGYLESERKMNQKEQSALRQRMRDRYAVHYSDLKGPEGPEGHDPEDSPPDPPPEGGGSGGAGPAAKTKGDGVSTKASKTL